MPADPKPPVATQLCANCHRRAAVAADAWGWFGGDMCAECVRTVWDNLPAYQATAKGHDRLRNNPQRWAWLQELARGDERVAQGGEQ